MKSLETVSNQPIVFAQRQHDAGKYRKVFDQRKRRIRGLWKRNDCFYAQMTITDSGTGKKIVRRTRLEDSEGNPVQTVPDAVKVANRLKVKREDNKLSLEPKRTPTFEEYSKSYITHFEMLKDAKRPATMRAEKVCIRRWNEYLGHVRLRQINKALVNGCMAKRQSEGVSARTVNLELVVLRNVLRKAVDDGYLNDLQIEGIKWLKYRPGKRPLVSHEEIQRICDSAIKEAPITGQMLSDFIKLMAYSGGRWSETLRLRWQDVDFEHEQLTFGADGLSKNGEARAVDFNAKLATHLKDMTGRRAPDSVYLFPSHRRGDNDAATRTLNMTLRKVREKAGMPHFTCHLCRHFFVSFCIMSGIDFMTVARWAGHKDGGILIGKVYGHLTNEHAQKQAQRLNFEPVPLSAPTAA